MNRPAGVLICGMLAGYALASGAEGSHQDQASGSKVLSLQQAIRMALDYSPQLAMAQAQAVRATEALRETRSLNLPQVITGTGLAYNNGFPLSIEGSAPSLVQVGLSQSILNKKNKNLIFEAEENRKASQLGPEAVRNELAERTALAYYELHQARKVEVLWSSHLEVALREQKIAEALLEAGRGRPVDVTLAKTATSNAQQRLLVSREQARLAEMELRELTGFRETGPIQTLEPKLENEALELPVETLYQRTLEIHPELQQAEAILRARQFHTEAEKGEYYPRLEIISQYALFSRTNNYQDLFNRFTRNNFLLGLSVQVPLFNGYRTSARVAQSQQEVAEARFRVDRLKSELKLGIERSASQLRIARGAVDMARLEVAAAQESLQVIQSLNESGRLATKELESARVLLQQKEIAALEAEKTLWQRQIEHLRFAGALTSLF